MCLAIPGRIVKIEGRKATVKYPGETRFALIGEEEAKKGDFVMVQMGIVVRVLTPQEAKNTFAAWKSI